MNTTRPVNLDLGAFKWPVTAIASILHRVCAVIVWIGLGFLLLAASYAAPSKEGFDSVAQFLNTNFLAQFVAWGLLTATGYYCMGTIKHLVQDMGFFESLEGGKAISWVAIVLGVILSILAGVYVWL